MVTDKNARHHAEFADLPFMGQPKGVHMPKSDGDLALLDEYADLILERVELIGFFAPAYAHTFIEQVLESPTVESGVSFARPPWEVAA